MEEDFLLALRLQEQFDTEDQASSSASNRLDDAGQSSSKKRRLDVSSAGGSGAFPRWEKPERPLSIVDASWETLDPSPDVRAMFLDFNHTFFWGKLSGVEVKWSPRMTLCAGVCSYEGRGGLCSIRLSEPLLKLRPRKDLVQTLLHEMIHALLFVTQNNRDRDGHGPEFCKHMNRINDATGTNISVYHSFHDEVDVYRQHWWRCNGPCQNRKPYFGYVKRAMNRVPSSLDPWWENHRRTCGGTYTKIKEPEGYGKKGKKDGKKDRKTDGKTDGKTLPKEASGSGKPSSTATGAGLQDIRNIIPFTGKGFLLGGKSQTSTSSSPSHKPSVPLVKTPSSSPVFSPPKKLFPPSSPAKALTSPFHSGISGAFPSTGQRPPKKRSVGNTRVFVSINGSPVRIPKPHSSSRSQGAEKTRQRSIEDLFNRSSVGAETKRDSLTSPDLSTSTTSVSSQFPKQQSSSSARTPKPGPAAVLNRDSPDEPTQSKYFNSDSTSGAAAAAGGQNSRKRQWDDRSGSASIFDYFQKTLGTESAASRESVKTRSPAVQQRTVTATATATATASSSSSITSSLSATSSSSSSSSLTVSCPVCQTKVQQSKINEHLDSCLS
ncbi:sprT-like domain-containing protein Spartan [Hippoglossus hippoglossus]|uniref:sprT-like domain-containing protein Spartan n=1 Tax=Hippoglossus hippoglossus TaxID=8267 RepID=UPI00148C9D9D|nr:sprT-like domain-containing protein Spartan [Hippoglossus hippoglossus]